MHADDSTLVSPVDAEVTPTGLVNQRNSVFRKESNLASSWNLRSQAPAARQRQQTIRFNLPLRVLVCEDWS
jgi:hypothetical protein